MADPVRVHRLTDHEGQRLLQIGRRGTGSAVRLRRAMVVLAPAGGNTVPAITRLVQGGEDAIRAVVHWFNEMGLEGLDPQRAGGRPRLINTLAALISIRATRPDGAPIYIILDNLSAHRGAKIRTWAARNKVELCFTPTYSSWANPIEHTSGHYAPSWSTDRTTPTTPWPPARWGGRPLADAA